jgi:hypothetical protein
MLVSQLLPVPYLISPIDAEVMCSNVSSGSGTVPGHPPGRPQTGGHLDYGVDMRTGRYYLNSRYEYIINSSFLLSLSCLLLLLLG